MTRHLTPVDTAFLALESSARPMHAGVLLLLDPPPGADPAALVERIHTAFRAAGPAVFPWNARAVFGLGLPRWETVEVDIDYHLRRLRLPLPGTTTQLMELLSHVYSGPLDHSRPLWEAYLVDGLASGQVGIFIKAHHAMFDGVRGARLFYESFSETPDDDPRPVWVMRSGADERRPAPGGGGAGGVGTALRRVAGIAGVAPQLARLVPDAVRLARSGSAVPWTAARTPTMAEQISSARSFAFFDLPLDEVRAVGRRFGGTINDVVLSVCDDAMHRYLAEDNGTVNGAGSPGRLVAMMAVSTRRAGDESGNASTAVLVPLGAPEASPAERLARIVEVTSSIKSEVRRSSTLSLQLQLLMVVSGMELRERLPVARGSAPLLSNFVVSNVPGPEEPRYLGGAKLAGFYPLPIVTGSQAANFTMLPVHTSLCVGIGAARNLLHDTSRLADLALDSFAALRDSAHRKDSA